MSGRFSPIGAAALAVVLLAASCSGSESGSPATTTAPPTTVPSTTVSTTTTAPPTTTEPLPEPGPTAAELCALTPPVTEAVVVEAALLTEISGIAISRQHANRIWAHNDSGGSPRLHLIDADLGADLGAWPLAEAGAFDWEDMAIHTTPDGLHHLYAADFGDNFRIRADIRIYRAGEPDDLSTPAPLETDEFVFTYPGEVSDAESFFVDPSTGDFIVITKSWDDTPTGVYRAPADTEPDTPTELEKIGEIDLTGLSPFTTAADITVDGSVIGVRTYQEILLWDRAPGQGIGDALNEAPCLAPAAPERQGEALAFFADGSGYMTISEGENPPINRFAIAE